ncbi:MAG: 3'(2'),5'-bisphosphate nucleotidase CysQ [Rhizobiaceae bacterium]
MLVPEGAETSAADDLALIRAAAAEAGRIALRYFRKDPEVWMKGGTSPVSEADIAVDRFLRKTLGEERPSYGWLSEETVDTADRLSALRTFVVDPIDGTRAFVDGRDVWCVSIAVVENGRPLCGVLDCPARDEVYEASKDGAALKNSKPIKVRKPSGVPVVAGPRPLIRELERAFPAPFKHHPYVPSLAYRIAMLAEGLIDGSFVKANSHDWDLAAADLILEQAGGRICDVQGHDIVYASANPKLGILAAGSGALLDRMVKSIAEYGG